MDMRYEMCVCASRCGWKVFTGNEVAALLGWWMFSKWRETHGGGGDVHKVFMLATTVSSKILQAFARAEGFQFEVRNAGGPRRWGRWRRPRRGDLGLTSRRPLVLRRKRCRASSGSETGSSS